MCPQQFEQAKPDQTWHIINQLNVVTEISLQIKLSKLNFFFLCLSPSCQFTRFKCGGLAVGVSWAHVLGDAVSKSNYLELWGRILGTNQRPPKTLQQRKPDDRTTSPITGNPLSVKKVEPAGDFWLASANVQMSTFSFDISKSKMQNLQSKISGHIPAFEAISALIWQSLAEIRVGKEPNLVTIIRNDTSGEKKSGLGNNQTISTAATDSSVVKLELSELAMILSNSKKDEKKAIDEMVEKESGKEDLIVYGANLTFVDMQGVELYGLQLKGQKPVYVDYNIHGVGEEGAVMVLPGPDGAGDGGRVLLTVVLPEDEIPKLQKVLESE